MSESWSTTRRLSSSGISRSKLRSPASTWAMGMRRYEAVIAAATVELTSPTTISRSGRFSTNTGCNASMILATISPLAPEPILRFMSGAGMRNSSKNTLSIRKS